MNKVILIGRLTKDPEVRFANSGDKQLAIARYTLAVDRKKNRNSENNADFISCIAFDRSAEFVERYLKKGTKIAVTGRIQTGSYTNNQGIKVFTTDVVAEEHEFVESKSESKSETKSASYGNEGFMSIPSDVEDGGLPFN